MAFDQFPAEIETQARSFDVVHLGVVRAHEAAKDASMLAFRNTNAVVLNGEEGGLPLLIERDSNIAGHRAVLNGIVDEVAKDLLDTARVHVAHEMFLRS